MSITIQEWPASDTSPLTVKYDLAQTCDSENVDVCCNGVVVGTLPSTRLVEWRANPKRRLRKCDVVQVERPSKRVKAAGALVVMEQLYHEFASSRPNWCSSAFEFGSNRDDIVMLGPKKLESLTNMYHDFFATDCSGTLRHSMRLEFERSKTSDELEELEQYLKSCWCKAHDDVLRIGTN